MRRMCRRKRGRDFWKKCLVTGDTRSQPRGLKVVMSSAGTTLKRSKSSWLSRGNLVTVQAKNVPDAVQGVRRAEPEVEADQAVVL